MADYLTVDQLGCATSHGVPRCWVGEDGDAIAVTTDRRRGLAAIHAMARVDLGGPASLEGAKEIWARFYPLPEEACGDDIGEWVMQPCQEGDDGALRVVYASALGELGPAALPPRQLPVWEDESDRAYRDMVELSRPSPEVSGG